MDIIFKKNIEFRSRKIGKQNILIGNNEAYKLNESGIFIWDNIDGKKTKNDIVEILKKKYDDNIKINIKEIEDFIDFLFDIKAIKYIK